MTNKNLIRINTMIDEQTYTYLKKLSTKAKLTGGKKLANTEIIRATLAVMMDLDLNHSGIKTETELSRRILTALLKEN